MQKFGWLFIGTGKIANKVAKEITKKGKHKIVACYSRNYEKCSEFASKYNAIPCKTISEALSLDQVEGVYICTPHASHYQYLIACINAYKPVLCEKSFTINAMQAEKVIELAKEKHVYVSEAMWTRYNPITKKINGLVAGKKLGQLEYFAASFGYNAKYTGPDRVTNKDYGGGALLDTGVYTISYALMLLGEPRNITVQTIKDDNGVDLENVVDFDYCNNVTARLHFSINRFTLCKAVIVGSKGSIYLPYIFFKPIKAIVKINGLRTDMTCKKGYRYQFDQVASDILGGRLESAVMPLKDTIAVMRTMDRIRKLIDLKYPDEIERV